MPPARTIMPPAKPQKTERTHEENQERAYIAASRRSDRSLEARVESARRASEIHKRRTGRSLRVTEQDVINEEMYEEEDDDLPFQYRQLTAHLQTNNADFNRRLAAYLTNHVATRSALEQSLRLSYAQQGQMQGYSNGQQFPTQYSMFPSPMLAHQAYQQPMMQLPQSPSTYRQAPYPSPRQPQQSFHQRSQSIAVPQETSASLDQSPHQQADSNRRLSMPTIPAPTTSPEKTQSLSSPSIETTQSPRTSKEQRPSFPPGSFSRDSEQFQPAQNAYSNSIYNQTSYTNTNFGSFSTALAPEAQGLLGANFGFPNDPLVNNLMMGNQNSGLNYHDMMNLPQAPSDSLGMSQTHSIESGLKSTLAPSMNVEQDLSLQHSTYFSDAFNADSKGATPAGTPGGGGDGDWTAFVEENAWEQPSASQTSQ